MANGKCKCGVEFTLENSTATVFKRKQGFCRSCDEKYQQEYYKRNSEKIKVSSEKWSKRNVLKRKQIAMKHYDSRQREYSKKSVARYREKLFGITQQKFEAKFAAQRGLCEICKQPMLADVRKKIPCQDHNHVTGRLRDLLCSSCNLLIGNCCEDKEILANAIRYLQKHESDSSTQIAS